MKTRIIALGGLAALLTIGTTFGVMAQTGTPQPPTPPAGGHRPGVERHPELQRALHALENAKMALNKADRDFGGHRAKAEELTEKAIQETRAAIAFDKK